MMRDFLKIWEIFVRSDDINIIKYTEKTNRSRAIATISALSFRRIARYHLYYPNQSKMCHVVTVTHSVSAVLPSIAVAGLGVGFGSWASTDALRLSALQNSEWRLGRSD